MGSRIVHISVMSVHSDVCISIEAPGSDNSDNVGAKRLASTFSSITRSALLVLHISMVHEQ
jgi:hypothetical protein